MAGGARRKWLSSTFAFDRFPIILYVSAFTVDNAPVPRGYSPFTLPRPHLYKRPRRLARFAKPTPQRGP
ncbi:hypothetical protein VNO78_00869 [Psophocarpus tetragonolobus]|uniref:Uncharacterized protein n=1 Tax=Psophocarpus tetragonolobus TaxID=3891 RepID=A0AAN9T9U8_PSOTE